MATLRIIKDSYVIDYRNYGVRKRLTLGRTATMSEADAMNRLAEMDETIAKARTLKNVWHSTTARPSDDSPPDENGMRAAARQKRELMKSAKRRAEKHGFDFSLTENAFDALIIESRGRCALCGIPFSLARGKSWRRPFAPSIDRIQCDNGYSHKNCRLVCVAVNIAMNEWGYDNLVKVAVGLSTHTPQLRVLGSVTN